MATHRFGCRRRVRLNLNGLRKGWQCLGRRIHVGIAALLDLQQLLVLLILLRHGAAKASVGLVYSRLRYRGREHSSHLFHASSRIAVLGDTRSDCACAHFSLAQEIGIRCVGLWFGQMSIALTEV